MYNENNLYAKPFLKWAGGKGQLLNQFEKFFPAEIKTGEIENYYEPFLGGGAVFFYMKSKEFPVKNFYLYDINDELIRIYKVIQRDVSELIDRLKYYEKKYFSLAEKQDRKTFYLKVREKLNNEKNNISKKYSVSWIDRASQLIFLNRTCFNGLFRFNKSGDFNVPFGDYKNPKICDESNLCLVNKAFQNVKIKILDFRELTKQIKNYSFVYFDPPYMPLNKTSSFTSYSKFNFGIEEQKELAQIFKSLNEKHDIRLMLSNSDPKGNFFYRHYKGKNIKINKVEANRMINCIAERRGKISELVITNYDSYNRQ